MTTAWMGEKRRKTFPIEIAQRREQDATVPFDIQEASTATFANTQAAIGTPSSLSFARARRSSSVPG
jgi:hypothetical protein